MSKTIGEGETVANPEDHVPKEDTLRKTPWPADSQRMLSA